MEPILTEDGKFACSLCKGTKETKLGGRIVRCLACSGSGLRVDELENEIQFQVNQRVQMQRDRDQLRDWVIKTSDCSKCGGDQSKTWGGTECKECGLVGTMPWGG